MNSGLRFPKDSSRIVRAGYTEQTVLGAGAGGSAALAATADEKLRVAQNQYEEQEILIEDLLRASADVAQARRGVEDAKLAVWMSWTDLKKAMGEE